MIPEDDLTGGSLRLLEVDNRVVLPINTHIRVLITSADFYIVGLFHHLVLKLTRVLGG